MNTVHRCQGSGNKSKKLKAFLLVGVKTTIHLFTYSLSGNKMENGELFLAPS